MEQTLYTLPKEKKCTDNLHGLLCLERTSRYPNFSIFFQPDLQKDKHLNLFFQYLFDGENIKKSLVNKLKNDFKIFIYLIVDFEIHTNPENFKRGSFIQEKEQPLFIPEPENKSLEEVRRGILSKSNELLEIIFLPDCFRIFIADTLTMINKTHSSA